MSTRKTVPITGATSGIGRAAALPLAARDHRVIATGRGEPRLAALLGSARRSTIEAILLDVARPPWLRLHARVRRVPRRHPNRRPCWMVRKRAAEDDAEAQALVVSETLEELVGFLEHKSK